MTLHAIAQMPDGAVLLVDIDREGVGRPVVELRPVNPQRHEASDAARVLVAAGNRSGGWSPALRLLEAPDAAGRVKLLTLVFWADVVGQMHSQTFEHEADTEANLPARAGLLAMAEKIVTITNDAAPGLRLQIETLESLQANSARQAVIMEKRAAQAIEQRDRAVALLREIRETTRSPGPGKRPPTGKLGQIFRAVATLLDETKEPPPPAARPTRPRKRKA